VIKIDTIQKLTETSSITTYQINKDQTVGEILRELNLEQRYFAVLVNGRKVNLSDSIEKGSEIVILPKIAGGF
jgi:sulfur carrier protein ThiS